MLEQIKADLKTAILTKNLVGMSVLRMAIAAFSNESISKGVGYQLTQSECEVVIKRMIKSREDSASQYEAAGRKDLQETEQKEIEILKDYLPKQLTEEEIQSAVAKVIESTGATSKKEMGKVMKELAARYGNTFDGKVASRIVQGILK